MASKIKGKLRLKLSEILNNQTNSWLAILGLSNFLNTTIPTTLNSR